MLDRSVAELYEISTKEVNQARKRNEEKFPEDFAYQLTKEELAKVVTICDHLKFSPVSPWCYTWEGCNMLATIIKSDIATQRAIQIVRGFTGIEKSISNNDDELLAQAVIVAQEKLKRISEEKQLLLEDKQKKEVELKYAHRRIGFLECKKDVRATEARIQEMPRLVTEHYGFIDYKVAMRLIYKEWTKRTHYNLQRKWKDAQQGRKSLTLSQFLIEKNLAELYIQICEALLENTSRGTQHRPNFRQQRNW